MEDLHERLRAALNPQGASARIGVYLGDEHLGDQQELPVVIFGPLSATVTEAATARPAPQRIRTTDQMLEVVRLACYARTFTGARELALLALQGFRQATGDAKARGPIRYGTEKWGERYVRFANLDLTVTYTLDLTGITVAQVEHVIMHAHLLSPGDSNG